MPSDSSGSNGAPAADSGLSAGAIAGAVVGCVAGASLLGAAALILWNRRKQQRRRLRREQYVEARRQLGREAQQGGQLSRLLARLLSMERWH